MLKSIVLYTEISVSISILGSTRQFSFIPSPNITILQSAVYQCTALTGVSQSDTVPIHWRINGISSTSDSWKSYITSTGITATGAGTLNTTLTIPGEPVLNETTVECIALGLVNGGANADSDSTILYIQGIAVQYMLVLLYLKTDFCFDLV